MYGFWEYYREYTRTAVHAAATAALTAFGLLTYVHPAFAAVAICAYVLPPIYLYATRDREVGSGSAGEEAKDTGAGGGADRSEQGWTVARTPTDATLLDVAGTGAGAHAVGEGGVVLARTADGWETALDAGPAAEGKTLRGVDATADGEAVWVAGDGGALGRLDAGTGRHADHSAPNDVTNAWTDVAVAGPAGAETVVLVDGSGQVLRGEYADGVLEPRSGSSETASRTPVDWGDPIKPGSGSSMAAATFVSPDLGYACDTNAGIYETRDGGGRYERIGVDGAGAFADVAALGPETVVAADADGALHRYDGSVWTRLALGDSLRAVDLRGDDGLACGDGGAIHRLTGGEWEPCETPASPTLHGVRVGDATAGTDAGSVDVAVGADGAALERRR